MILDDVHRVCHGQAIDSFGNRYLLGVFENKADAEKAFDSWNKEYEQVGISAAWPGVVLCAWDSPRFIQRGWALTPR